MTPINSFNASGIGGANCIGLYMVDADNTNVWEFVNGVLCTQDSGAGVSPSSGTYGYGFPLKENTSTTEYGWNPGAAISLPFGSSTGGTVFLAFNGISAVGGTCYMYSVSNSTVGTYVNIAFGAGTTTPLLKISTTTKVTGTSAGANTAFSAAVTGTFGTSKVFTLYQDGASVGTPFTGSNFGASANMDRIGGVNGQGYITGSLFCAAFFNVELTSTQLQNLHNSMTGAGAFSLITQGAPTVRPSQLFLQNRPGGLHLPIAAAAPMAALAWLADRRERLAREEGRAGVCTRGSWRQEKRSRLFLPTWLRRD